MLKKIIIAFLIVACASYVSIYIYKHSIPKAGTIIRYEIYKCCKVPIKADGKGGKYRWIGDVPWDKFTIEEKCKIAFSHGGWLNENDIEEINQKYGPGRRR